MKINQSTDRKQACKRYCGVHKIYYFKKCPMCIPTQQIIKGIYLMDEYVDRHYRRC